MSHNLHDDFNNDVSDFAGAYFIFLLVSRFPRLFLRPLYALMFVLFINMLFGFGWWNITPANTPDSPAWVWGLAFVLLFIPTEFFHGRR